VNLGKRARVAFDFNKAKDLILTGQPDNWKTVRKICLGLAEEHKCKASAVAYHNAKKIMNRLSDMGIVSWDDEAKKITYNI